MDADQSSERRSSILPAPDEWIEEKEEKCQVGDVFWRDGIHSFFTTVRSARSLTC